MWIEAFEVSDDEGLRPILEYVMLFISKRISCVCKNSFFTSLLQKLAHDLRTTLSPIYTNILNHLLELLPRSIDAAALTALLETFSALFKFLLVPSIRLELLEETWNAVRLTLPRCLPEVKRAVAEVWGSVLRRLKTVPRARAVTLLAKDLEEVEDASAWAIVYACKVRRPVWFFSCSFISPLVGIPNIAYCHHVHLHAVIIIPHDKRGP